MLSFGCLVHKAAIDGLNALHVNQNRRATPCPCLIVFCRLVMLRPIEQPRGKLSRDQIRVHSRRSWPTSTTSPLKADNTTTSTTDNDIDTDCILLLGDIAWLRVLQQSRFCSQLGHLHHCNNLKSDEPDRTHRQRRTKSRPYLKACFAEYHEAEYKRLLMGSASALSRAIQRTKILRQSATFYCFRFYFSQ